MTPSVSTGGVQCMRGTDNTDSSRAPCLRAQTLTQVDHTFNIVVPEEKFCRILYQSGLATRDAVALFLVVRTALVSACCTIAFLVYVYGIGYQSSIAGEVVLLYLMFLGTTFNVAIAASLIGNHSTAAGTFGVYSALQVRSQYTHGWFSLYILSLDMH